MNSDGLSLLGIGCVTALGRDWGTVWSRLQRKENAEISVMQGPGCPAPVAIYKTPLPEVPDGIASRLRRSSAISYFACAAAADAIQNSGLPPGEGMALVYAASDGSVAYTRRFYEDVVAQGTGSPLLFPETVYNASASHMAAMLGLEGIVLTLVNDATVGMAALSLASDLIHSGGADRCLVVAAEELDWITCEGYRRWGLTATLEHPCSGAVLTEGAVAFVLGPPSPAHPQILRVHPGRTLSHGLDRRRMMTRTLLELADGETPELAVLSSSGPGPQEELSARECFPEAELLLPKLVAGEAFAASSLLQCLCAWECLGRGGKAVVPVLGWSGQIAGAFLASAAEESGV